MTDNKPMTLWHGSRANVERPTIAGRVAGDNHSNSGLGIFCATGPHDYVARFGDAIHAMTIKDDARIMTISTEQLQAMGETKDGDVRSRDWFDAKGRDLAKDFDVAMIAEHDGWTSQAIILRDDAVASSKSMTKDEFAAVSRSMSRDHDAYIEAQGEKETPFRRVRTKGPSQNDQSISVSTWRGSSNER
jgi:hypothetical protein